MEPKVTIQIDIEEYEELKDQEAFLAALYTAGVDNWIGYDYALDIYNENKGEK